LLDSIGSTSLLLTLLVLCVAVRYSIGVNH
jgi:hypothetical protein